MIGVKVCLSDVWGIIVYNYITYLQNNGAIE